MAAVLSERGPPSFETEAGHGRQLADDIAYVTGLFFYRLDMKTQALHYTNQ